MNLNNLLNELTNEAENPCWDGYEMVGTKMKDGKEVPNCVPKTESVNEVAYENATKNELAQYIINLTKELKSAKSENDKTKIKYLERDMKEVKAALAKKKNESIDEETKPNSDSAKFLKGMKKIKVNGLGGYMPGITYIYKDTENGKYYYVSTDGGYLELLNKETLKQFKKQFNESVYSNQTGIKSAMLGEPKLVRLLSAADMKWASGSNIKIFKEKRFFIFTDGRREMVVSYGDGDFKIMKKLGRISKVTKGLYNENINEDEKENYYLDLDSVDEAVDKADLKNAKFRLKKVLKYLDIEYKETRGGKKYVQINYIPVTTPQWYGPEFVNVRYEDENDLQNIGKALKLKLKESVSEGVMGDINLLAKSSNSEKEFIKQALKKYGKEIGTDKEAIKHLLSMYDDAKNESVNEAIDSKKLLSIYNGLKKGDTITIKYNSSMSSNNEKTFIVTSGNRTVGKAKVERITMVAESNPKGVKFYLYKRNGNVSLAIGNMAASIVSVNESINEAKKKLPKFKNIPDWARYVAQHSDGEWTWYEDTPTMIKFKSGGGAWKQDGNQTYTGVKTDGSDWDKIPTYYKVKNGKVNESVINEDFAKKMQKEFEKNSKFTYSEILSAVRAIQEKYGYSAISNPHRLRLEVEKLLPGVDEYMWDIAVSRRRQSSSHGTFVELLINEKFVGNIFV
jgi:hypothetical protein